jgi:hypothetical protein
MDLVENGGDVVDFVKELAFRRKAKETATKFSKHNINPNYLNLDQVRVIICRILKDANNHCRNFVSHFKEGLWSTESALKFKEQLKLIRDVSEPERLPRKKKDRGEEIILGNEMKEEKPNE